jgi:chromate reductase
MQHLCIFGASAWTPAFAGVTAEGVKVWRSKSMPVRVAVIVGSLRRESINLKLAKALMKLEAPGCAFDLVDISDLPHYNNDLWPNPPASVARLKSAIESADAVLFVTPEYNRGIPGLIKDVVDWGSRPYGKNSWSKKPAAIIGASPGKIGTAVAQSQLRSTLLVLNLAVMGEPEAYVQVTPELIEDDFTVTNEGTRKFLQSFLGAFADWIERVSGVMPDAEQPGG